MKNLFSIFVLVVFFMSCSKSEEAYIVIGEETTIGSFLPEGSSFNLFGDITSGVLYINDNVIDRIMEEYGAVPVDSIWEIDINGITKSYSIMSIDQLDLTALAPPDLFGEIQGAHCTSITQGGKCVNMYEVDTGMFTFSWYTPTGGLSWCVARPANTCKFIKVSSGTERTYALKDCKGPSAGVQQDIRICQSNLE